MAPPTSPTSHSRTSSNASARLNLHAPTTPSQLRNSHVPSERSSSPEETMHSSPYRYDEPGSSRQHDLDFSTNGIQPSAERASVHSTDENVNEPQGGTIDVNLEPTVRSRLLNHKNWDDASGCGEDNCNHGQMSPRPASGRSYGSFNTDGGFGGRYPGAIDPRTGEEADATHALLGDAFADGVLGGGRGNKSTTQYLAERAGVKHKRLMSVKPSPLL